MLYYLVFFLFFQQTQITIMAWCSQVQLLYYENRLILTTLICRVESLIRLQATYLHFIAHSTMHLSPSAKMSLILMSLMSKHMNYPYATSRSKFDPQKKRVQYHLGFSSTFSQSVVPTYLFTYIKMIISQKNFVVQLDD